VKRFLVSSAGGPKRNQWWRGGGRPVRIRAVATLLVRTAATLIQPTIPTFGTGGPDQGERAARAFGMPEGLFLRWLWKFLGAP
jgi:hypothetical protein